MITERLRGAFSRHFLAVIFGLIIGFIYIAPHIFFVVNPENKYQGVFISRASDEENYLSVIHETYDGNKIANPYLFEYKNNPSNAAYYYFIEYSLGRIGKIFNLTIANLAYLMKFIFPIILFFTIYIFLLTVSKDKGAALLGSVLVLLGNEMVGVRAGDFISTIFWQGSWTEFLAYSRPVNPSISSIFFFLALYCIYRIYNEPEKVRFWILGGALIGFTAYLYFYFWFFPLVLLAVIFVYSVVSKNKLLALAVFLCSLISLIIASPFIFSMLKGLMDTSASVDKEAIQKTFISTHRIILEKIIFAPLLALAVYYFIKLAAKKFMGFAGAQYSVSKKYIFIFLLLLAALISSNQQVLSGMEIQQHHFHFFVSIPIFFIAMAVLVVDLLKKYFPKFKTAAIFIIISIVVIYAVGVQASTYKNWQPTYKYYQRYADVFNWLNKNSEKESVVYANLVMSGMIPMYTKNNVYNAGLAVSYLIPQERLLNNYFVGLFLAGITKDNARASFYQKEQRDKIGIFIFEGQYWRDRCGSYGCFPDAILDGIIEKYLLFLQSPIEQNFKQYRMDYLLWDKNREPEWRVADLKFLEPVYEYQNIVVYKIN